MMGHPLCTPFQWGGSLAAARGASVGLRVSHGELLETLQFQRRNMGEKSKGKSSLGSQILASEEHLHSLPRADTHHPSEGQDAARLAQCFSHFSSFWSDFRHSSYRMNRAQWALCAGEDTD